MTRLYWPPDLHTPHSQQVLFYFVGSIFQWTHFFVVFLICVVGVLVCLRVRAGSASDVISQDAVHPASVFEIKFLTRTWELLIEAG